MTDDEIRERAFGFVRKNADNWSADDIANLASLLASERAAALGAAAMLCDQHARDSDPVSERDATHARYLANGIRSLSPEVWTAVRAEDLAALVDAARYVLIAHDELVRKRAEDTETEGDYAQIPLALDELRAALARLP